MMRLLAPAWLIICLWIALYRFNQGNTGGGLYFCTLAIITAISILRS